MLYDRFSKRYFQYAWFIFLCGLLYGMALCSFAYRFDKSLLEQISFHKKDFLTLLLLMLYQCWLLWWSGCSVFANFLSKTFLFVYGLVYGGLTSLVIFSVQNQYEFRSFTLFLIFLSFSLYDFIHMTLLMHSYSHTIKTSNEKEAFFPYTYRMFLLTFQQILRLLILKIAFTF